MNRRELFQAVAGVAAASGVTGTVKASTYDAETKPALAVFEYDGPISHEHSARIIKFFEEHLKGTPFEGLKAVVFDSGLKLTLLDSQGHVLNRRLEDA